MQQTANLIADSRTRVQVAGKHFLLLDVGAATSVELWIMRGNEELEYIRTAKRLFKARVPDGFTHLELKATVNATCELVISNGVVDFDPTDGANINATIVNPIPVPVSNDRGSVANPVNVTAVTVADAPALAIVNHAPVACAAVVTVVKAANANVRRCRFKNLGPDPVALGGAGITWANRTIVLELDETWIEDFAGGLAWSGICDAGKTAGVTAQEITQ